MANRRTSKPTNRGVRSGRNRMSTGHHIKTNNTINLGSLLNRLRRLRRASRRRRTYNLSRTNSGISKRQSRPPRHLKSSSMPVNLHPTRTRHLTTLVLVLQSNSRNATSRITRLNHTPRRRRGSHHHLVPELETLSI